MFQEMLFNAIQYLKLATEHRELLVIYNKLVEHGANEYRIQI